MFREMRRSRQQLPLEEAERLLKNGTFGVLALLEEEGYPYAVPLSYAYENGRIYFHCATQGQKLDAIRHCGKASFCVVARDDVRPEKLTTLYRSVIAFGCVRVAEGEEKRAALETLGRRYAPGLAQEVSRSVQESWNRVCALVLEIEHITGKEGRELAIERGEQA